MNERAGSPPHDTPALSVIEVTFGIPVYLTENDYHHLQALLDEIINRPCNQPRDGVHWLSSAGSKPNYSSVDAALLGVAPAPEGIRPPDGAEPTFDDSVLSLSATARPFVSDRERQQTLAKRAKRSGGKL